MTNMLKAFTPEVEVTIKATCVVALVGAYLVTFAWGYEGRQQARRWREVACAYRLSELTRATPGVGTGSSPCETLDRAGVDVATAR